MLSYSKMDPVSISMSVPRTSEGILTETKKLDGLANDSPVSNAFTIIFKTGKIHTHRHFLL